MKAPLPESLRPAELEGFVGQPQLRSQIEALLAGRRALPSLLLFGPPGCGKSTLALLLARSTGKKLLRLSAPEAGIQQLRRQLSGVEILVLDELHRFSKAQQDFFLPILESGEMTMIATTTENPSFSVTRQLLSRLHVLRLRPLSRDDLVTLARRGAEKLDIEFPNDVLEFLAALANGDARALLNLVEYVAGLPEEQRTLPGVQKVMPEIVARHDKDGDSHYELASAMIKSIRGSDPDAALYYLACLLEGGEDPRFICRRLILSASEDVGLADPHALPMAVSCQQAVEFLKFRQVHMVPAGDGLAADHFRELPAVGSGPVIVFELDFGMGCGSGPGRQGPGHADRSRSGHGSAENMGELHGHPSIHLLGLSYHPGRKMSKK